MSIITKTEGHFIINAAAFSLEGGKVVSYRDGTVVQEFESKAEMQEEHEAQFPEQYEVESEAEETPKVEPHTLEDEYIDSNK